MKKIAYASCIISGIVFIFAGIVKLFPISSFEFQMVSQGQTNYLLAPFLSRFLIGVEIILGIGLLQRFWLKRFIIPASISMLVFFSFYLAMKLLQGGSPDNCGCFGQILPMSNLSALVKNIFLISLLVFAYTKISPDSPGKLWHGGILLVVVYAILFIAFPIKKYVVPTISPEPIILRDTAKIISPENLPKSSGKSSLIAKPNLRDSVPGKPIHKKVNSVYSDYTIFITSKGNKAVDLNEAEKIVAILSLDCDHCLAVAKQLSQLALKNHLPKVYALFLGDETQVKPFFEQAGCEFPYIILPPEKFFPLLEKSPPRIVYLENGNVICDMAGEAFSAEMLLGKTGKR